MHGETKKRLVIVSLLIATFLTAIEGTIVSTAMPKIVDDLGGSHLYTWVISIYLLATVISSPIFGKLADLYGRKRMFTIGVITFLVGSMLSGLSQTMEQLVLFRLLQGLGAGALATIPMTIVGDVFPFEQRAKIQGYISSIWGISGILGPLIGGFIVDVISWHWIFYMNVPFGIISLILLHHSLHEILSEDKPKIDYLGIAVFTVGMSSFLYALNILQEEKQVSGLLIIFLFVTVICFGLFLWIQTRATEPMVPLTLFQNKFIIVAYSVFFCFGFILITVAFYIPLWVQGVTGLNATLSGIAMLPMSLTWPAGAMVTSRLLKRISIIQNAVLGIGIIIVGCIGLVFFKADTTIPRMMLNTAVLGAGFGLTSTLFTVIVQSAVAWDLRGAAMGTMSLMRNLGQTIGIAISGIWLTDQLYGERLQVSLQQVFFILVGIALLTLLMTFFLRGKELQIEADETAH